MLCILTSPLYVALFISSGKQLELEIKQKARKTRKSK